MDKSNLFVISQHETGISIHFGDDDSFDDQFVDVTFHVSNQADPEKAMELVWAFIRKIVEEVNKNYSE